MLRFTIICLFCLHIASLKLESFQVTYSAISGLLFSDFTCLAFSNNTAILGDSEGYLNVFAYDEKKRNLLFKNTNRPITPILSHSNQITKIEFINDQSFLYLSSNGKLCFAILANNSNINNIGQITLQPLSKFKIINKTHFMGISYDKMKLCLYKSENLVQHFSKDAVQIYCNKSTKDTYENVEVYEQVVATGSKNSLKMFHIGVNGSLEYDEEIFLLKSEEETLALKWVNGETLVSDNGLWLSSIVFESNGTNGKVLSSLRIEKTQTKGYSDTIALIAENKNLDLILINGYYKGILYQINNQSKITFSNQSNTIGKIYNQEFISTTKFISTQNSFLQLVSIDTSDSFKFTLLQSASILSSIHYSAVQGIGTFNGILVSVADGGQNNFKTWKITPDNRLQLVDQKTFTYFSILNSGYTSFNTLLIIAPEQINQNAKTQPTVVIIGGTQPYELILIMVTTTGEISEVVRSTAEHSKNITCLFRVKNFVLSGSKDTTVVIWALSADHKSVNKSLATFSQRGPISGGIMDSFQQYILLTHDTTFNSKVANITLWKFDGKTGKLAKIAESNPNEAHLSNITSILFMEEEQRFVTYSATTGELKLWQHEKWTIVDLVASLSLGLKNMVVTQSKDNTLVLESQSYFYFYSVQADSFILSAKIAKQYPTIPTSIISFNQQIFFQGANDGAIRTWKYSQSTHTNTLNFMDY